LEEAVEPEVFHSQTFKQTNQNSFLIRGNFLQVNKKALHLYLCEVETVCLQKENT